MITVLDQNLNPELISDYLKLLFKNFSKMLKEVDNTTPLNYRQENAVFKQKYSLKNP